MTFLGSRHWIASDGYRLRWAEMTIEHLRRCAVISRLRANLWSEEVAYAQEYAPAAVADLAFKMRYSTVAADNMETYIAQRESSPP